MALAGASSGSRPRRHSAVAAALLCVWAWALAWPVLAATAATVAPARASLPAPALAPLPAPLPALDSPVRDSAGALSADTRMRLETRARELRQRTGAQLQVLIVASTAPEPIEAYAQRAFDAWALGRRGVDDGVLLVVARDDRRARIQVGYGLEGRIPDAAARQVLSDRLLPLLARGDYDAGVDAASAALAALIAQEPLPASAADASAPAAAPAWSPLARICALGAAFALTLGWCARRRGWPLARVAPAALLPPAIAAWLWSGPAWLWLALLWSAAGGALGQALPRWRWLRSAAGAAAVGLALAATGAALVRGGVPAPGDIGLGAVSLLLATPLLVGLVAPPMIAWQGGRLGFVLRIGALAALAWLMWWTLLRLGGGDLSALGSASWLGIGVFGYLAWVLVFSLSGEICSGGARRRDRRPGRRGDGRMERSRGADASGAGSGGTGSRAKGSRGTGSRSTGSSGAGSGNTNSGDSGWSGGGGRSGGGGASGSW